MTTRTNAEIRKRRHDVLRPLFAELEAQGRSRVWLGAQLGVDRKSMYAYEAGENRIPSDFVERAGALIGFDFSVIDFGDNPALFIQQRRAATREKGRQHAPKQRNTSDTTNGSSTSPQRPSAGHTRRTQPAAPAVGTPTSGDMRDRRRRGRASGQQQQQQAPSR